MLIYYLMMTFFIVQDFKKNVKGVNGGKDFDQDMLTEIFQTIRFVNTSIRKETNILRLQTLCIYQICINIL